MLVRLAFSVMMEADADILLIDEVLAVGDAAFQQKCADAFHEMKAAGKTIVLVTHEMAIVEEYCHRAMLIDDGKIQHIGDPAEVGAPLPAAELRTWQRGRQRHDVAEASDEVRADSSWLEDAGGARLTNLEHGSKIRLRLELERSRISPGSTSASSSPTPTASASSSSGPASREDEGRPPWPRASG